MEGHRFAYSGQQKTKMMRHQAKLRIEKSKSQIVKTTNATYGI